MAFKLPDTGCLSPNAFAIFEQIADMQSEEYQWT